MGLMDWVSDKLKIRDDLKSSDKSYIVEEIEKGIHKRQKEDEY